MYSIADQAVTTATIGQQRPTRSAVVRANTSPARERSASRSASPWLPVTATARVRTGTGPARGEASSPSPCGPGPSFLVCTMSTDLFVDTPCNRHTFLPILTESRVFEPVFRATLQFLATTWGCRDTPRAPRDGAAPDARNPLFDKDLNTPRGGFKAQAARALKRAVFALQFAFMPARRFSVSPPYPQGGGWPLFPLPLAIQRLAPPSPGALVTLSVL